MGFHDLKEKKKKKQHMHQLCRPTSALLFNLNFTFSSSQHCKKEKKKYNKKGKFQLPGMRLHRKWVDSWSLPVFTQGRRISLNSYISSRQT